MKKSKETLLKELQQLFSDYQKLSRIYKECSSSVSKEEMKRLLGSNWEWYYNRAKEHDKSMKIIWNC